MHYRDPKEMEEPTLRGSKELYFIILFTLPITRPTQTVRVQGEKMQQMQIECNSACIALHASTKDVC